MIRTKQKMFAQTKNVRKKKSRKDDNHKVPRKEAKKHFRQETRRMKKIAEQHR